MNFANMEYSDVHRFLLQTFSQYPSGITFDNNHVISSIKFPSFRLDDEVFQNLNRTVYDWSSGDRHKNNGIAERILTFPAKFLSSKFFWGKIRHTSIITWTVDSLRMVLDSYFAALDNNQYDKLLIAIPNWCEHCNFEYHRYSHVSHDGAEERLLAINMFHILNDLGFAKSIYDDRWTLKKGYDYNTEEEYKEEFEQRVRLYSWLDAFSFDSNIFSRTAREISASIQQENVQQSVPEDYPRYTPV